MPHSNNATASLSLSQQLASPISILPIRDHTEPSPQLPPPLSSSSLQKLTLNNGEEFGSIRRELATDAKTPAEYTLHIVFTQFVRHAERKLNLCLEYPIMEEPPILDLIAEGVDPQFDKIVASLGYIARRKPKPVIDSVMFWRKSKNEVATMAANEVERTLAIAKANLIKVKSATSSSVVSPENPGIVKNGNNAGRSKRSLSLMRTKSLSKLSHRRNQSASSAPPKQPQLPTEADNEFMKQKYFYDEQINQARETAIQADRKSLASIYILCRVLIEVVKQTSFEVMGEDLGDKLEEIVYTQLKTTDPITTSQSFVRAANWNLFAELLGFMSERRFLSVSDRFIADLEKIPKSIKHEDEPKLHLLINGMRYLKLTNYPLEVFEESAEFVKSLAKFFDQSTNETILYAYCEVLSKLLLPLANILTAEANHPTWVEGIERIYAKAYRIWRHVTRGNTGTATSTTPTSSSSSSSSSISWPTLQSTTIEITNNGWAYSLYLVTSALSVSRKELFSDVWYRVIEDNNFKLKPKVEVEDKTTYIICISRLLWVYINRLPDSLNNTIKRLDGFFEMLLFNSVATSKKNQWITNDKFLISSLVELVRIVGYTHLNYTLDNVLIRLLKLSFNGTTLDNLMPEKVVLVIKSYLAILRNYELGEKPAFPTDEIFNSGFNDDDSNNKNNNDNNNNEDEMNRLNEFTFIAKNSTNSASHEEICRNLGNLLKLLDNQFGADVWGTGTTNLNSISSTSSESAPPLLSAKSQSSFSFHFNLDSTTQANTKALNIELFASVIEAIPWTMTDSNTCGIPFKHIVDILTRSAVHSNHKVSRAAIVALKKLASRRNPTRRLLTIYAQHAFQFSEKIGGGVPYDPAYLNSNEYIRLLKLYVELLACWLKSFQISQRENNKLHKNPLAQDDELMNKDVLNDLYQINHKTEELPIAPKPSSVSDELEWQTIIALIEEVEGHGLFFLCSQEPKIRYYAISILKLMESFDQAIYTIMDEPAANVVAAAASSSSLLIGAKKLHSRSSSKFAADVGTRLIHVLENADFLELIKPYRKELSLPERTRLTKIKNKKNILIRLAESDYGIDSTIWFRLYPKLLDIFFEKCPMPVAVCRNIVCVSLVQMHESILEYSESYRGYTSSLFGKPSPNSISPELLVYQWKLYLIFACCSLTSTNDQKISFPSQPTHGRKKSLQIYIQHQKITSAKSVFRMVLPLLKSPQSMVRDAVISGLSHININIFDTFLENIPQNDWNPDPKKRDVGQDRLNIEVIHILMNLTERFANSTLIYHNKLIMTKLVSIVKNVKNFLSAGSIQTDFEFQRLRRYFCGFLENVYTGCLSVSDVNKWLPFEARIGCFNYLKEWSGYGQSSGITEDRYNLILSNINQQMSKDKASAVAILELERKRLQTAALSCMAVLCSGEIKQKIEVPGNLAVVTFDIPGIMNWIRALFDSDGDRINEIGKTALNNILERNFDNTEVYDEVIKQCFSSEDNARITKSYFCIFVDVFIKKHVVSSGEDQIPYDLVCLAAFLVGHESIEVRRSAMMLLKFVEQTHFKSNTLDKFTEAVSSKTQVVYKRALFDISTHLKLLNPETIFQRTSYMTKYFNSVGSASRRDILSCLLPWVQDIVLKYEETNEGDDLNNNSAPSKLDDASIMVLNNLFEITVKFSSKISNEVEALWVSLGNNALNFDKIIEFVMSNCLQRKNPLFVQYSRQIIDYLTYSRADPLYVIEKFINNLQPKMMVPPQSQTTMEDPIRLRGDNSFPYVADLSKVVPRNEKDAVFSLGQLSLIFLVDLFTVKNDIMIEKLPLLLHIGFSLLDHYLVVVQESAKSLLVHLIHALAFDAPGATQCIETLRQKDHIKHLWVYDDLNNDKKGARTPKNMDILVRNVLQVFVQVAPNIQDDWSRVSLKWATTCAVRHIACRSFQLFRSLLSFLDQGMLKDMLHRLSNTISDEIVDIQGFAMQILMTLNAITAELDSEKLIDFPQLFWSSVACLSTIHEQEFIEVLSTMSKFVSKIDLDAPDTVSCLISTFPPKWEGKFEGLQQIVMVGLRSSTSWEPSLKFLDKLITLKDSEIIGKGDSRILMSVLANFPRFLHALDQKSIPSEVENTAIAISKLADQAGKVSLSKILVSLSKNRFLSKKDFLVQTVSTIKNSFFPEYEAQALVMLLGMLSNKIAWVKLETMSILKHVFPLVDLQRDEFVGVGADLISPLLRLLLTDFAEPALEVLDEAVIISGSQLDRDVLRMSLGNTSMKKEYENTATLFGIPDDSGWSIPMPAVTAASTRNNVHAVFSTCGGSGTTVVDDEDEETLAKSEETIQFHMEDYYSHMTQNVAGGGVDFGDAVSVSVADEPEASLSNVWAALDDFDSFFTKDNQEPNGHHHHVPAHTMLAHTHAQTASHHLHSASVDTNSSDFSLPMDSPPNVYDKKVSLILNRSLARTQSTTSFKTTLADSIGSNVANTPQSIIGKRSYIPFRSNRNTPKTFTTPVIGIPPNFPQTPSDFQTPTISSNQAIFTGLSAANANSEANMNMNMNMNMNTNTNTSATTMENGMFEGLLGGKKRSRRAISKENSNTSINNNPIAAPASSPEMKRNYKNATGTVPRSSPTNGGDTPKDRRRVSQKFR
ncbi:transcriptional activator leucine zipper [Spathaspora passalidarum NRRL Y-27907]|uniref:Transcriptional activator leucine zipper n=1 Tax=Spathaspora passalidarum (strain NRRL Y-27907 / 11-Y1) TaxID=619300 RepID=G3ARG6_SPAPN|nr:transcriptional activator leucine zipper [Spathaspora passalidarum NRRL Y-27907]EGW31287.1 transcriptional activator leucine zipper [Spathaspora passalidarum NRRL Y-27907]